MLHVRYGDDDVLNAIRLQNVLLLLGPSTQAKLVRSRFRLKSTKSEKQTVSCVLKVNKKIGICHKVELF